jgi:hypothetical protein
MDYYNPDGFPSTSELISSILCPNLEHLSLWNVSCGFPIDVAPKFPKLISLHLRVNDRFRDSPLGESDSESVVDVLTSFKDNNIYFFTDLDDTMEEIGPQWSLYEACVDEMNSFDVKSPIGPLIQWLTLSTFFFADFYGLSSSAETAVEIDLRSLGESEELEIVLAAINSMENPQIFSPAIWARITLDAGTGVGPIWRSMPLNIHFLDIEFIGSGSIPESVMGSILASLPRLFELRIVTRGPSSNTRIGRMYARFTRSSFTCLFPFLRGISNHLTLIRGEELRGTITVDQLREGKEFIAELEEYFVLSSSLQKIEVELRGNNYVD